MPQTCVFLHEHDGSCNDAVVRSDPVIGQANTSLRRLLLLVATASIVLAVPAVGGASSSPTTTSLQAQNAALTAKSRAAVLGLYSLDQRLAAARVHLATLQSQLQTMRAERATLRRALGVARTATRIAQRHVARRLQLLYEHENVEPLEILLGAKSLDDAMNGLDNLKGVARQDNTVLREVTGARTRFTLASTKLAARVATLEAATSDAAATAESLVQTRAQRSAYIASLATQRRMNDQQISTLVARAQAAQVKSAQLAPSNDFVPSSAPVANVDAPAASVTTSVVSVTGGRTLTVVATGYALGGSTSTGLPVGWGVAAVDPSVIPLGSHMTVPGYGEAVAADTGGAIVGNTIDLWFPTVAQANAWGRRVVTIVIH
jgi:3D (Asp-Asp-Asp) domain-containing protein